MARTISIGAQGFEDLRTRGDFYVDKTGFVRDWWRARDAVTLVCRPRHFGKTLNLNLADVLYLPQRGDPSPALLVELKWDRSPEAAITQARCRDYPAALRGWGGPILLPPAAGGDVAGACYTRVDTLHGRGRVWHAP